MPRQHPQHRSWCYTLNNYTPEERKELLQTPCHYHICGEEKGENGTPHLQGYMYLKTKCSLLAMKRLQGRAHWEPAKGTAEQNKAYCSKQGRFVETGVFPSRSGRNPGEAEKERWAYVIEKAKANKVDEIAATEPDAYVRFYHTLNAIAKDHMGKPDDAADVTGTWIYGAAGVGKSRKAREEYPGAYFKQANKWWDGYQGEEWVIIDDLDPKHSVLSHHLKIWMDRYSFIAEIKGGARHIRPKGIIITSQYSIEECFPDDQPTIDAIRRRCQGRIIHLANLQVNPLPPYE
jgi:hypothetical protein